MKKIFNIEHGACVKQTPCFLMLLCLDAEADDIDRANGTLSMAVSAAGAFFKIDLCAEAVNDDSFIFAGFDALHAADASGGAFLAGNCAFIVVFAENGSS